MKRLLTVYVIRAILVTFLIPLLFGGNLIASCRGYAMLPSTTDSIGSRSCCDYDTKAKRQRQRQQSPLSTSLSFSSPTTTALFSIGTFLSGITGVPPSQLIDVKTRDLLLSGTSLDRKELICAYKASRDGWTAIDFHSAVDGRGSALVVVLRRGSATIFGGYNPLGWMSTDDYASSNSAFLWFLSQQQQQHPIKCPVLLGGNAAIFDYATGGPCFGAADLEIGSPRAAVMGGFAGPDAEDTSTGAGNLKEGSSSIGGAYNVVKGWPARGKFKVTEVECYCNADIIPSNSSNGGGVSWWPF